MKTNRLDALKAALEAKREAGASTAGYSADRRLHALLTDDTIAALT